MPQFEPGNKAGRGRPKGSKNKVSDRIRQSLSSFLMQELKNVKTIDAIYETLTPAMRVKFLFEILPYCVPKLQPKNLTPGMDNLTEEQVEELYNKIMQAV